MREQESMEVKVKPTYKCHRTGLVFDTMKEVYQHRIENYPLDYVHGVPFQFLAGGIYLTTYPITFVDGPLPVVDLAWAYGGVKAVRVGGTIGGMVGGLVGLD